MWQFLSGAAEGSSRVPPTTPSDCRPGPARWTGSGSFAFRPTGPGEMRGTSPTTTCQIKNTTKTTSDWTKLFTSLDCLSSAMELQHERRLIFRWKDNQKQIQRKQQPQFQLLLNLMQTHFLGYFKRKAVQKVVRKLKMHSLYISRPNLFSLH